MASGTYPKGVNAILAGTVVPGTSTTKIGLAQSTYAPATSETSLSTFATSEASCTGYTGAHGGSGRKAATPVLNEIDGSNQNGYSFTNLTWTALGGASNQTLKYAVWMFEGASDAAGIPLAYLQFTSNITTNGSDVALTFAASPGNVTFTD